MNLSLAPALRALASIRRAGSRTWTWFAIYFFAAVLVLEALMFGGLHFAPQLRELALTYLFPDSWHPFVTDLVERLLSEQMKLVYSTAGMALAIFAVGITLFPIKEKLSASFEADAFPDLERGAELSLLRQGWEELKLLAIYAVFQCISIYAGLQGMIGLAVLGSLLGYWYLAIAMALDHAAPVFQRRGIELLQIIHLLVRHVPLSLHLLGILFIAPAVVLQLLLAGSPRPELAVTAVVCAEVLGMALATMAGCSLGAELIAAGKTQRRASRAWTWGVTALTLAVLAWQATFFGWLGLAAHHKSQLLKCHYQIEWRQIRIDSRGRADESGTGGRIATITLSLPLVIDNPTAGAIALEDTTIEILDRGQPLGTALVPNVSAKAKRTTPVPLEITLEVPIDPLAAKAPKLLDPATWRGLEVNIVTHPPLSNPLKIPVLKR